MIANTVDMEKFTGLNFCGFNPTKVFVEILLRFLSQKCLLLKSGAYTHGKTFASALEHRENQGRSHQNLSGQVVIVSQVSTYSDFQIIVIVVHNMQSILHGWE